MVRMRLLKGGIKLEEKDKEDKEDWTQVDDEKELEKEKNKTDKEINEETQDDNIEEIFFGD